MEKRNKMKTKMTEIEKLEAHSKRIAAKLIEARKNQKIKCAKCWCEHSIKDLTIEVETYYVQPSGCTEGDYWTTGKCPDYAITCPECKHREVYKEYRDMGWDYEYEQRKKGKYCNRYIPLNMTKIIYDNIYMFKNKLEYYYEDGNLCYHANKEIDDLY